MAVLYLGGVGGAFGTEGVNQVIGYAALPLALIKLSVGYCYCKTKVVGIIMLISRVGD